MTTLYASLRKLSLAALSAVALAGCTSLPVGQIAHVGQAGSAVRTADPLSGDPVVSTPSRFSKQEILASGLSPNLRRQVTSARARTEAKSFEAEMAAGRSSFSTLSIGPFGVQSACQCPLDNKMYAIGGRGLDATNALDRIYEYDPTTHSMTQIATTESGDNIASAAVAKHPFTGEVWFLQSYSSPRRLYKYNRTTNTRSTVGATNLPSNTVQLTFSRSGILYAYTEANKLYTLNQSSGAATEVPLSGVNTGSTGGDIAFYTDDDLLYRVDANRNLYLVNLATGTNTLAGAISGIPNSHVPAGLGFNPAGQLLVLTYNTNDSTNRMYSINLTTRAATQLQSYSGAVYPLADLTSAERYTCPRDASGRPTAPTMLINDNFVGMASNFGNLPLETSPDTTSGWRQWNADYYPTAKGVTVWNPGSYNPAPGGIDDPNNDVLGVRDVPGEYISTPGDPRPHLLETSISKTVKLKYNVGDKVKAKLTVSPTFNHAHSDATLMICFDDPGQTVAVSSTLRGSKVKGSELYVEVEIPDCATKATVIALGYLGETESSSVTFEKASLEFIPGGYYSSSNLLTESFDSATSHATYGANFPAGMDEQFGAYDLFLVNNFPSATGDKALTGNRNGASGSYGGVVKRVNLPAYGSTARLSAQMYTATTFSDASSEASLLIDFFNSSNVKLGSVNAQPVNASQYRWIEIDRAAIPTGATYVKVAPVMRFGSNETSSLLMNNLSLNLLTSP